MDSNRDQGEVHVSSFEGKALSYSDSASKLHQNFGEFLILNGYGGYTIIQEANVKDLCPTHKNGQDRFDYYIPELALVIELHGQQHYQPARFGNISKDKATLNYVKQVGKDSEKHLSALRHKYLYISFNSKEPLTLEEMNKKLDIAAEDLEHYDYERDPVYREYEDALEEEKERKRLLSARRREFGKGKHDKSRRPRRTNLEE